MLCACCHTRENSSAETPDSVLTAFLGIPAVPLDHFVILQGLQTLLQPKGRYLHHTSFLVARSGKSVHENQMV